MTITLTEGLIPKTSLPYIIAKHFQSDTMIFTGSASGSQLPTHRL